LKIEAFILIFYIISRFGTISDTVGRKGYLRATRHDASKGL
jgi:hypothetical protein